MTIIPHQIGIVVVDTVYTKLFHRHKILGRLFLHFKYKKEEDKVIQLKNELE